MNDWLHQHKTLLLDMDGTLLDLAFDNCFWMETLPGAYASEQRVTAEQARQTVFQLIKAHKGTLNWYCLDFWSDTLGLDVLALKRRCPEPIRYLRGAEAFLQRARAAGFRLVLVTNSSRPLLALKEEVTAISRHMDAVYSSGDFGAPKETQAFWQRFAQTEGIRRKECLLLDDSADVLRAGEVFGLGGVLGVRQPDSRHPARPLDGLPSVNDVSSLLLAD